MDLNDLTKNPEQIKSLITLLEGLLLSTQQEPNTKDKEVPIDAEDCDVSSQNKKIKTRGSAKRPAKDKYLNKFDKMSESNMHKDDNIVDKALSKHPPVARMREFEMVDVTCRICGKTETINPALIFDSKNRYKCNNCSTQAG
jgi:hypothetical protein